MLKEVLFWIFCCWVLLLVLPPILSGSDYFVPAQFPTIQGAIDVANQGDTIYVDPGTYGKIDYKGKAISVRSTKGPEYTIIDAAASGSAVVFEYISGTSALLEGFTITNGSGRLDENWWNGGGIICDRASPTIKDNIITANRVIGSGGGIYCYNESAPQIIGSQINANFALWGGGVCCADHASPSISGNLICDNRGYYRSGGIECIYYSSPLVTSNVIARNRGEHGGGVVCFRFSSPQFINCSICDNIADQQGGALFGMGVYAEPVFINSILWNNSAPVGKEMYICGGPLYPTVVTFDYSVIDGGTASVYIENSSIVNWGHLVLTSNPLFFDALNGDYHLTYESPCRDAGDSTHQSLPLVDMEGDQRSYGFSADIGADEFHPPLYCCGSIVPGDSIDIRIVGTPGVFPITLAEGSAIKDPPSPTQYGPLYLEKPYINTYGLREIPPSGIIDIPSFTVPQIWQPGKIYPFQALLGEQIPGSGAVLTNLMVLRAIGP